MIIALGFFCASLSAFKVDVAKIPPECREAVKEGPSVYSQCVNNLKNDTANSLSNDEIVFEQSDAEAQEAK